MSDLGNTIRDALGPEPTPLPESAPKYLRRDDERLLAAWEAIATLERMEDALCYYAASSYYIDATTGERVDDTAVARSVLAAGPPEGGEG